MEGTLLFLGTGGSLGVPVIGCDCSVCMSDNPCNHRTRPSVLLRTNGKNYLIDAGPEFRIQALRYGINRLTGVLFTHSHHDHIAGVDDLRAYSFMSKRPLPALMSSETAKDLKNRFHYLFQEKSTYEGTLMKFDMHIIDGSRGQVDFEGLPIRYVTYEQGGMQVNGFIIGSLAYLSDIKHYSEALLGDLKGVKTLIVSALRFTPSPLHFTVDEAVDFIIKSGAERGLLTHISHDLDHDKTNAYLPSHIRVAYDGLQIEF